MKIKQPSIGVEIIGKIPSLGVTKYIRNGSIVTRVSRSEGRRSNTRSQFIQRQRMRHGIALWKSYHIGHPCSLKERLLITAFFRWPTNCL